MPAVVRCRRSLSVAPLLLALAAQAQAQTNLFWAGGSSNIADDTPVPTLWSSLSGTWNASTQNFSSSLASPVYQAWSPGAIFNVNASGWGGNFTSELATVTVEGSVSAGGIHALVNNTASPNSGNKLVAFSGGTINLSDNARIHVSGDPRVYSDNSGVRMLSTLSGNGLSKTGERGLFLFNNQNGVTGTVRVVHDGTQSAGNTPGTLSVTSGATLAGATRFEISTHNISGNEGSRLVVTRGNDTTDQLNDNAVISLAGVGMFDYRSASGRNETVGALQLRSSGVLRVGDGGGGTLTFTNGIDRTDRAQLMLGLSTSGVATATVNLGSSHGLGSGTLPWAADIRGRLLRVDGSNNLVAAATTDTSNVSTITDSTVDYRVVGNSTVVTGAAATFASGAQANTLGFYRGTTGNPVTVTVTDSLTLTSGGLAAGNDNNDSALTITGGSSLTTANNAPLFIGTGTSTASGSLTINTPITGNIDVAKAGNRDLVFGGTASNTYTGVTYVNSGRLLLNKTGTGVTAIAGDVVVRNGGSLVLQQSNLIADSSTVRIERGGYFLTGTFSETFAHLAGDGMLQSNATTAGVSTRISGSVSFGDASTLGTLINDRGGTQATSFTMLAGSVFNFKVSADGTGSDQMVFYNFTAGEFVLNNNAINVSVAGGLLSPGDYTFTLFRFFSDNGSTAAASIGITSGLTLNNLAPGIESPSLLYHADRIDLTFTVIPEPATAGAVLGLLGLGFAATRRRRCEG